MPQKPKLKIRKDEFDSFFLNESTVANDIRLALEQHHIVQAYEHTTWGDETQGKTSVVYLCVPDLKADFKITVERVLDARPFWDCEFNQKHPKSEGKAVQSTARKIHYAGALRVPRANGIVTNISAGWAACCSGKKAEAIRRGKNNTTDPEAVTCLACRRQMKAASL